MTVSPWGDGDATPSTAPAYRSSLKSRMEVRRRIISLQLEIDWRMTECGEIDDDLANDIIERYCELRALKAILT